MSSGHISCYKSLNFHALKDAPNNIFFLSIHVYIVTPVTAINFRSGSHARP